MDCLRLQNYPAKQKLQDWMVVGRSGVDMTSSDFFAFIVIFIRIVN